MARFDGLGGLLDETVGELADVDQTVLMHADVDEGSELGDVGDDALEYHVRLDVAKLAYLFVEAGCDELIARVAAGLAKFLEDIAYGIGAGGEVFGVDFGKDLRV